MIVISRNLTLSPAPPDLDPSNGVILWQSVAGRDNTVASSEDDEHPLVSLLNTSTNLFWRAESVGEHTITVTVPEEDTRPIDGFGFAGTNFGSAQIPVLIEASESDAGGAPFETLALLGLRPDDGPALVRGPRRSWRQIRITMQPGLEPPRIAVLQVGPLLVLHRGITASHTPIEDGYIVEEAQGRSVAGDFLGGITLSERVETSVTLSYMEEQWFRHEMRPFVRSRRPFFYAWWPTRYPREVGFVWFPAGHSPRPVQDGATGTMALDFSIEGIVR